MTVSWEHYPETEMYGEAWTLSVEELQVAMVARHTGNLHTACIYPLGKSRQVGDIYGSAGAAKAACVRQLRKTGVIR